MIGRLTGTLLIKQPPHLLVEVSGVGYEIEAPMSTFYQLPDINNTIILHTHLVVRDDAHLLYGFFAQEERTLFRTLIKVNGVGPKLALTILSSIAPQDFVQRIIQEDMASLVRLPGVGKKTAERLIIEMRDILKNWEVASQVAASSTANHLMQDAVSALEALGYKTVDSIKIIKRIAKSDMTSEDMIRLALQGMMA